MQRRQTRTAPTRRQRWSLDSVPASALPLVVLALGAAAIVLALTLRNGLTTTPDSANYVAAARSLREHGRYQGVDGAHLADFPPVYPAVLSFLSLTGLSMQHVAAVTNALSSGGIVLLGGLLLRRVALPGSGLVAAVATLLATPLLGTLTHAWSEPLFTCVWLAALLAALRFVDAPRPRTAVLLGLLLATATLTRYIGAVALLCIPLSWWLTPRDRRSTKLAALAFAAALLPVVAWLALNQVAAGTFTGERVRGETALTDNLTALLDAGTAWLLPDGWPLRLRTGIVALVALALVAGAARGWRHAVSGGRTVALLCLANAVAYLTYLLILTTVFALDPLDGRFLAPVLPVLIVAAVALAATAFRGWGRGATLGWAAIAALLLLGPAVPSLDLLRSFERDGAGGYQAPRWRDSELIAALGRDAIPDGTLLSNDPFAISLLAPRPVALSPRAHAYRARDQQVDDLDRLRARTTEDAPVYLAWFDGVPRDFLIPLEALAGQVRLEQVARYTDGALYRVRPVEQ